MDQNPDGTCDGGRRGSGISIPVGPSHKNFGSYPGLPGHQHPYYMQAPSYPMLMNPPPFPTYQCGVPPTPYVMGYPPMYGQLPPPVTPNLRRSSSMRMVKQDMRRAASVANMSEPDMSGEDFHYEASEATNDGPSARRSYSVRKGAGTGDRQPYPGVIIEEMLESASMQNGETGENYPVALVDELERPNRQPDAMSVLGQEQFSASIPQRTPVRWRHNTPVNTVVMFVPQQEAWIVERMGKFNRILDPGLNILIPIVDKVKYVQSLKEIAIDIPSQTAITIDNVTLNIDGVLYLRIQDPYKASYGVEDPEFAITQLAQTTMRSEIGKITLDTLFKERDNLNFAIVKAINHASEAWGIQCMRYEVRDIRMPARVQEAMQMQVEAERKKRAAILNSEGIKSANINVAEGKKQAQILQSEAEKLELINKAEGAAQAVVAAGRARAQSIELVSKALGEANGSNAAALAVAEKYVSAFQELAKTNNTLILPSNTGDVSSMVAQAMTIYHQLETKPDISNLGNTGKLLDVVQPDEQATETPEDEQQR